MKLTTTLLAVSDMQRSVRFYSDLFGQEVVLDLGENVTLSGGFALQQDFDRLVGIDPEQIVHRPNDMELYFETEDFDGFLAKLSDHKEVVCVHPPKMHDWLQRVVRIYDPDGHMIEIGESMRVIACRLREENRTNEEIAGLMHCPVSYIARLLAE